jgi:hypothetical protein
MFGSYVTGIVSCLATLEVRERDASNKSWEVCSKHFINNWTSSVQTSSLHGVRILCKYTLCDYTYLFGALMFSHCIYKSNFAKLIKLHILHRTVIKYIPLYEGVSKNFRTGRLERELQVVQLYANRCSCIAILWVILASSAAITLFLASQRVFIVVVHFFMTQSGNFWIHPRILVYVALKMQAPRSSQTLVSYHNTTQCQNPERPGLESSPPWKPQIFCRRDVLLTILSTDRHLTAVYRTSLAFVVA